MKTYNKLIFFGLSIIIFSIFQSCELDNYEGPNAALYGTFLDAETNEPVGMDIINGPQIQYIEHGYDPPQNQYMVIKTDGTYRNDLMFSGTYTIETINTNFVPVESFELEVKGETKHDFVVQPFIRIKDVSIQKSGNKIVANFKIHPSVEAKVRVIGLFGHPNSSVGTQLRTLANSIAIRDWVEPGTEFSLELDIPADLAGEKLFFRVGSKIDLDPTRWNYAPPVLIEL